MTFDNDFVPPTFDVSKTTHFHLQDISIASSQFVHMSHIKIYHKAIAPSDYQNDPYFWTKWPLNLWPILIATQNNRLFSTKMAVVKTAFYDQKFWSKMTDIFDQNDRYPSSKWPLFIELKKMTVILVISKIESVSK